LLFNALLDRVIAGSIAGHDEDGVDLWGVIITFLVYADDIVLISGSRDGLDSQLQRLNAACRSFGLTINIAKTKVLVVRRVQSAGDLPILVNGQALEFVDGYCYLGSWISADSTLEREISNRISRAAAAFAKLPIRFWCDASIDIAVRVSVYRSVVISALLYGAETWPISPLLVQRLEVFQNRCLRRMLGLKMLDKVAVTEIRRRCLDQPSIEELIRRARLRWLGHVLRRPERLPCRILDAVPRGTRPRGRPKLRWKDDLVWPDLQRLGMDWNAARHRALSRLPLFE